MQEKSNNLREVVDDEQLNNVTGGETAILIHFHPEIMITCDCGHKFSALYNAANRYECEACKKIIFR